MVIADLSVRIDPTPQNGCTKTCYAMSPLVTGTSKMRVRGNGVTRHIGAACGHPAAGRRGGRSELMFGLPPDRSSPVRDGVAIIRPTWRPDRYGNQDIGRRRRQYRRREMLLDMSKPIDGAGTECDGAGDRQSERAGGAGGAGAPVRVRASRPCRITCPAYRRGAGRDRSCCRAVRRTRDCRSTAVRPPAAPAS